MLAFELALASGRLNVDRDVLGTLTRRQLAEWFVFLSMRPGLNQIPTMEQTAHLRTQVMLQALTDSDADFYLPSILEASEIENALVENLSADEFDELTELTNTMNRDAIADSHNTIAGDCL